MAMVRKYHRLIIIICLYILSYANGKYIIYSGTNRSCLFYFTEKAITGSFLTIATFNSGTKGSSLFCFNEKVMNERT